MSKIIQLVNKGLFYGMFICGLAFAFLGNNLTFLFFILIPSLIVSWFIAKILESKDVSSDYELPINIALWLNILGEMYFYYNFQYYDKVLHLTIPFLIAIIMYEYISKNAKNHKPKKEVVFFTVLGMTALFEIAEYFLYISLQYPLVGVFLSDKKTLVMSLYADTIWDMIMNSLGILIYLIFKKEEPSKELKQKIVSGAKVFKNKINNKLKGKFNRKR